MLETGTITIQHEDKAKFQKSITRYVLDMEIHYPTHTARAWMHWG